MPATQWCKSCNSQVSDGRGMCPACQSENLIRHPVLAQLSIAHIDCDAFYASIEKRDNPDLTSKPVIIGGETRGVVATCCYIARMFGVRAAMPMFQAKKLCPNAVIIKPRMQVYSDEGRRIRQILQELSPLVQPVSIDEAYVDLTGMEKLSGHLPIATLIELQKRIYKKVGVTVSVGLADNKFLAKTASDLDKPHGFSVLSSDTAPQFLADKSPRFIHGVGPQLAKKLERDGFSTIADLQATPLKDLLKRYGETGVWLHMRAFGKDDRKVSPESERKSVSSETTFNRDLKDIDPLLDALWALSQRVADRCKKNEVEGRVVTLKLKTADFRTLTRRVTLMDSTQLANVIFKAATPLLKKSVDGSRFRLLGVGVSDLISVHGKMLKDAIDLSDPKSEKRAAAERAMDKARNRFGSDAVTTGRTARQNRKTQD